MLTSEQRQQILEDIAGYIGKFCYSSVTPDTTAEEYRAMAEAHGKMVGRIATVLLDDSTPRDIAERIRQAETQFAKGMVAGLREKMKPGGVLSRAAMAAKEWESSQTDIGKTDQTQ